MKHITFTKLVIFIISLVIISGCASASVQQTSSPTYQYSVTVQGAVNRTITQKEFYLEPIVNGREHIYIQEMGPGDDIKVLDIAFPESPQSGNYQLTSNGIASVGYYEVVGNVSRQFHENVNGSFEVNRSGQVISGSFDFVAQEPLSNESIRVFGEYVYEKPVPVQQALPLGASEPSPVNEKFFTLVFVVLAVLQFIIQFYVGGVVYKGQNLSLLRAMSGRRTFALGWRDPSLREVMFLWTLVIILMGGVIVYVLW